MDLLFACSSYKINFVYITVGLTTINPNYTNSHNFSDSYLKSLCREIQEPYLTTFGLVNTTLPISSMVNLVLLLVITIISILGARKEESKWLVLNWSVLNFSMMFYLGLHIFYPKIAFLLAGAPQGSFGRYISGFFILYLNHLCNYTIFPIAFNRLV
jgi:hypothetical protein